MFVVGIIVAAVVLVGAALVAAGRGERMSVEPPDREYVGLPDDPVHAGDVEALRFPTGWRGYRMADVDDALARLARTLAARDAEIATLRAELDALRTDA